MIFHKFDSVVTDHGDFISVETPSNPAYIWGNYLILSRPPRTSDVVHLRAKFRERFGFNPLIKHEAYTWEGANPETKEFLNLGFQLKEVIVMTATKVVRPESLNTSLKIRPLESVRDWDEALNAQVLTYRSKFGEESYRDYRRKRNDRFQRMIQQGLGQWFGAFLNGQLVGDMGLFKTEDLGRFQQVNTHPDFRRQRICKTLFYHVAQHGFSEMRLRTLAIAADENYFAKDIYSSIGFRESEKALGVELRPPVA